MFQYVKCLINDQEYFFKLYEDGSMTYLPEFEGAVLDAGFLEYKNSGGTTRLYNIDSQSFLGESI